MGGLQVRGMKHTHGRKPKRGNMGVMCDAVINGAPILLVTSDAVSWQFLCGGGNHTQGGEDAQLVCLGCAIEKDPSLKVLIESKAKLATRASAADEWVIEEGNGERPS